MSDRDPQQGGRLGFLDSLGRLFQANKEPEARPAPAPESETPATFAALEASFDAAVQQLNEKVEEQRRSAGAGATRLGPRAKTAEQRAAERERRIEDTHRAMREDIEKMHARLGTGVGAADLDAISAFLGELAAIEAAGKGSHSLLPRARYAIAERLRAEAGELAVARIVELLEAKGMSWPDPSRPPPTATAEEIERAQRRKLADVRRYFLAEGFARMADSVQGVIPAWGADYPDRGSPLWESCVLESVAAGIRGRLLRELVEAVRRERDALLREAEATVGREIETLQTALAGGAHSLEQATAAVGSALRVLDEVIPELAWERVRPKPGGEPH